MTQTHQTRLRSSTRRIPPAQIQVEHFTGALYMLLDEIFDNVHGYCLDKGTSLFETLATISAEKLDTGGRQVRHLGRAGEARGVLSGCAGTQRAH